MNIHINPIGIVKNNIIDPQDGFTRKKEKSTIEVDPKFVDGLQNLSDHSFIDVLFYFHQSNDYNLITKIYTGEQKGVFASRSPHRPNGIGVTTVVLHSINQNQLTVSGLDAVNGTPVIDIKPCDNAFFEEHNQSAQILKQRLINNPRSEIIRNIKSENLEQLLIGAAQMHGHFCPGLAMGIMAAVKAVNTLNQQSDGMEDLLTITETNNCVSDGIQYVTGCTFGNNALIFHDIGKTAFTLTQRNGKGIRISSRNNSREVIKKAFPEFDKLYQKVVVEQNHNDNLKAEFKKAALERSFNTLKLPFNQLFKTEEVKSEIPDYAPIYDSIICHKCGESTMQPRSVKTDNNQYCKTCSQTCFPTLDGDGIHFYNKTQL